MRLQFRLGRRIEEDLLKATVFSSLGLHILVQIYDKMKINCAEIRNSGHV
jgi:hypothetical protein